MAKGSGGTRSFVTQNSAENEIKAAYKEFEEKGFITKKPFSIGEVSSKIKIFSMENGITLAGSSIYMTGSQLQHARRKEKIENGIAVSVEKIASFPREKRSMDIYYDKDNRKFVYTDHQNKFILHPNAKVKFEKKEMVVNFITASKVTDDNEFKMKKYIRIK